MLSRSLYTSRLLSISHRPLKITQKNIVDNIENIVNNANLGKYNIIFNDEDYKLIKYGIELCVKKKISKDAINDAIKDALYRVDNYIHTNTLHRNSIKGGKPRGSTITTGVKAALVLIGFNENDPLIDYYVIVITLIILLVMYYKSEIDDKIRRKELNDFLEKYKPSAEKIDRRSQRSQRSRGGRKKYTRKHK